MVVGWIGGWTNTFLVTEKGVGADKWVREYGKNRFERSSSSK